MRLHLLANRPQQVSRTEVDKQKPSLSAVVSHQPGKCQCVLSYSHATYGYYCHRTKTHRVSRRCAPGLASPGHRSDKCSRRRPACEPQLSADYSRRRS